MKHNGGEAYGFLDYKGNTSDLVSALPKVKQDMKHLPDLSLEAACIDKTDTENDPALVEIVRRAKQAHMSHTVRATLPTAGNRRTAKALSDVLNGLYMDENLYTGKEPFYADVAYKRGDKYVIMRSQD